MATFKSVYDLMGSARKGKSFREKGIEEPALDNIHQFHGGLAEFQSLSLTETNILSGMSIPDNFTTNAGATTLTIGVTAVSHATEATGGRTELCNTEDVVLKPFETNGQWLLQHEHGRASYSEHMGTKTDRDSGMMGKVIAQCCNLSEGEVGGLARTLVMEMLSQKPDMRHMFMKGYLLLQDLNLSVLFRRSRRRFRRMPDVYYDQCDNDRKLGLISEKKIVVDSEGFTADELCVLSMMAAPYPSIKFCEDNIYNTCHMSGDDLAIISSYHIERSNNMVQSPAELYRNIVSIACKLECTNDLFDAFKTMRGRMGHIRDVNGIIPDRVYHCGVSLSNSHSRCFGGSTVHNVVCADFPCYMSTSVALVADMMLGECYELTASMLVEHMGGLGKLICEGTPARDETYNSILRDYGLSSKDCRLNQLMLDWESLGASKYAWSPLLTWKPYLIELTERMRNGADARIPQLTYEVPFLSQPDCVWGAVRGFKGVNGSGLASMADIERGASARKDEKLRLGAAFTWAMGVRKTRPKLYNNSYGTKEIKLSTREAKFLKGTKTGFRISHVGYTLGDEFEGREDWTELAGTKLIRTQIEGTRCSIVMSTAGRWNYAEFKEPSAERSSPEGISESVGNLRAEDSNLTDDNIIKMTERFRWNSGQKAEEVFGKLKGVLHSEKVPISGGELADIGGGGGEKQKLAFVDVPGDGKCGIHAVVASMKEQGMVKQGDEKLVFGNFDERLDATTFHDAQSIGLALTEVGVALRVYEMEEDGARVIQYGDVAGPGIAIERRGNHFRGVVEGKGDEVSIKNVEGGDMSNVNQARVLNEFRRHFM